MKLNAVILSALLVLAPAGKAWAGSWIDPDKVDFVFYDETHGKLVVSNITLKVLEQTWMDDKAAVAKGQPVTDEGKIDQALAILNNTMSKLTKAFSRIFGSAATMKLSYDYDYPDRKEVEAQIKKHFGLENPNVQNFDNLDHSDSEERSALRDKLWLKLHGYAMEHDQVTVRYLDEKGAPLGMMNLYTERFGRTGLVTHLLSCDQAEKARTIQLILTYNAPAGPPRSKGIKLKKVIESNPFVAGK